MIIFFVIGERNGNSFPLSIGYECLFPVMVQEWRQRFLAANGQTDALFSFGFVQVRSVSYVVHVYSLY